MPERTVKGREFSIVIGGQRIRIKHVQCKGKRCRVTIPAGAYIEVNEPKPDDRRDRSSISSNE